MKLGPWNLLSSLALGCSSAQSNPPLGSDGGSAGAAAGQSGAGQSGAGARGVSAGSGGQAESGGTQARVARAARRSRAAGDRPLARVVTRGAQAAAPREHQPCIGSAGSSPAQAACAAHKAYLTQVVAARTVAKDKNVAIMEFAQPAADAWGCGHPNGATHAIMADVVEQALTADLGW